MNKTVLDVRDLQEKLGISRSTAYALIKQPGFPVARIGRKIIIPCAALETWINLGGTQAADDAAPHAF